MGCCPGRNRGARPGSPRGRSATEGRVCPAVGGPEPSRLAWGGGDPEEEAGRGGRQSHCPGGVLEVRVGWGAAHSPPPASGLPEWKRRLVCGPCTWERCHSLLWLFRASLCFGAPPGWHPVRDLGLTGINTSCCARLCS